MVRALRACLFSLLPALVACSSYRAVVHERCPPTFGAECRDAYTEYFERDPDGARAAYGSHVRRLAASCERPVDAGSRERCTVVAALRAHATMSDVLRARRVPASIDPEALPADWEGSLAALRALCPEPVEGDEACTLLASFEAAERGEANNSPWFNGPVREVVAATLLDRRERLPADDVEGRRALLERVLQMSVWIGDLRYAGHPSEATARLLARIDAARAEGTSENAERALAELSAAVEQGSFDATSAEGRRLIRAAAEARRTLPEPSRTRLAATAGRAADAVLRDAAAQRSYMRALDALDALAGLAEADASSRWREALRAEGARHHEALSARHLSAGRPGSAWLHGMMAVALGGQADLSAARAPLARAFPPSAVALRVDASGCPWADPSGALPAPAAPAAEVSLRWTRCASDERRWETNEAHTFTARVEQTRTRPVQRLVGGYQCGSLERNCSSRSGTWQTVEEEVTETVPVERTVTEYLWHRELRTAASAEATVRVGDRVITATWADERPPVVEVQTTSARRPSRFSAVTLDDQRRAARESLAAWLGPGGGLQQALARDVASRLVAEAAPHLASDPEAADELYARAYFGARAALDPAARERLRQRLGLSDERMRAVFEQ